MTGEVQTNTVSPIDYTLIDKALQNKDVFTTLIVLFVFIAILMPLVYFFLRSVVKTLSKDIEALGQNIIETFSKHEDKETLAQKQMLASIEEHKKESKQLITGVMMSMGNTILNAEQTIDLLLAKMWFVSYGKLEFIKQVMIFNHIAGRREQIRAKIKQELASRSEIYMKDFRQYTTPVGDLADWLEKNFTEKEFESFVDKIVDVVYSTTLEGEKNLNKDAIISIKTNEIATIMKDLQNNLGQKLRKDIKDFN